MITKTRLNKFIVSLLSFSFFAIGVTVSAQSVHNISFPIPELDNCASVNECKAYCDLEENREVCEDFARKHNLDDRERTDVIIQDGGPGNCALGSSNPEVSCRAYCSTAGNMRECVAYGKKHGLMKGRSLEEAEKVLRALESGASLPAGCVDEESCRAVCENPASVEVARECFSFAEKAGFLPEGVDREKAERMFRLIEEGRAPFNSPRDFEKCHNPEDEEILESCISFGLEAGIIPEKEAQILRKTRGKGPGGCVGREECQRYCESNQEACFKFAHDNDLIPPEARERVREGVSRLRAELEKAPPEVSVCLREALGREVFDGLLSGSRPMSQEVGERMRACFEEQFKSRAQERFDQLDQEGFAPEAEAQRFKERFRDPQREDGPRQGDEFVCEGIECAEKFRNFQDGSFEEVRAKMLREQRERGNYDSFQNFEDKRRENFEQFRREAEEGRRQFEERNREHRERFENERDRQQERHEQFNEHKNEQSNNFLTLGNLMANILSAFNLR